MSERKMDADEICEALSAHEGEGYQQAAALIRQQAKEIERLKALLRGRDIFIVDQGLWLSFVDSLPRTMKEPT